MRHEPGGPSLASIGGATSGPSAGGGTGQIVGFKTVRTKAESPIVVDSQISLFCVDGSFGNLVDGNAEDSARTLTER